MSSILRRSLQRSRVYFTDRNRGGRIYLRGLKAHGVAVVAYPFFTLATGAGGGDVMPIMMIIGFLGLAWPVAYPAVAAGLLLNNHSRNSQTFGHDRYYYNGDDED